jgi:hypothetical protein
MQMSELKQRVDRIEQCADDAEQAMRAGSVPTDLRQRVDRCTNRPSSCSRLVAAPGAARRSEPVA